MRRSVSILPALVIVLAGLAASRAGAQNVPDPAKPNPAPARVQVRNPPAPIDPQRLADLLNLWEQNSGNLKSLDVRMTRTDRSPAWGEDDHYEGRAMFKVPNLAWLDFQKQREVADPATKAKTKKLFAYERIICTGTEVWQYRCDTSQIFIYPLEKDVQQRALEEGPLPFLFNFKAAEAKRRYDMTLVAEDENTSTIRIIPRLPIDQDSFKKAFVVLDRQLYLLPRRIYLILPDEKSSKDFVLKLTKQVANCNVDDANFHPKAEAGWKVVRNPGGDDPPSRSGARVAQPVPAPAAAEAPVQRPAMRSRIFGGRQN
jgi:TIGR03009 family protein